MTEINWLEHIGSKVDIVNGDLQLSDDGFLTVSTHPFLGALYVDKVSQLATPIPGRDDFRGRLFKYRTNDCATLYAEWSDHEFGTDLLAKVKSMSRKEYLERTPFNLSNWLLANGFSQVEQIERGDLLLLNYFNHVAAYLGDDKVLHHISGKYSSIDALDSSAIIGAYRYAK
jgi:hypothetical protein